MAEDDKGYGPWSRVPGWDGSPLSWLRFKRDVTWWLSSLDLSKTTGYNLAARFLLRQEGVARQRGEEFSPDELAFVPPPKIVDPLTGEQLDDPDAVPDYLVGVNKLLKAWEEMTGRTALDKRGELCQAFYMDLSRKAGERVSFALAIAHWWLISKEKESLWAMPSSVGGSDRRSAWILCENSCWKLPCKAVRTTR